ncbi:phage tail tube protein [Aliihoeflea sp. PC F10.4]
MSKMYWRKLALLAKVEATYGIDAAPTGSADAILAVDVNFTPLEGGEENRDLLLPYLGNQGVILTGLYGRLEFSVEVAGAGAAGDVPGYGSLLRGCGLAETVTAGTEVEYAPVSNDFEAVTLYYNRDGVRHVLLGCRGNVSVEFTPQRIARYRFNFIGFSGTVTDQALPAVDVTKFQTPVVVTRANTTFSLHGYAGPTERISIDLGNQVEPRLLIGSESAETVDRQASGSAVLEARRLATINWDQIARGHETGSMALVHGTAAGNIVSFTAPRVQIGRYTEGQTQGIKNNTLPLMFMPDAGDDELIITVR